MIVKIGDVISEYSVRNKFDENIPVYSVTNEKGFCTGYFSKEVASKDKSTYKIVPRGYFAYNPSRINVGSVDWQKYEDRVIVSPLYVVFGVSDRLDRQYLLHYLKSDMMLSFIKEYATGSVRDNLKLADLGKFPVNLRPVEEQRQIAATLDKIDELIAKRRQQLNKLDELVKSRFIEMFGVYKELKRLETYATLITKGASPKWQGVDYCEEGTLFVTSENVREGYLDLSKRKYLDDKINEIQPRSMLKRNDILINIVGASIGRAAIYNCDELANINQAVALVRVNYAQINQTYLITYLNSPQALEMYSKMKKGGARDNLSLQNIAALQIPVAPMEVQNQFAAFVEQTDKSKSFDDLEVAA